MIEHFCESCGEPCEPVIRWHRNKPVSVTSDCCGDDVRQYSGGIGSILIPSDFEPMFEGECHE